MTMGSELTEGRVRKSGILNHGGHAKKGLIRVSNESQGQISFKYRRSRETEERLGRKRKELQTSKTTRPNLHVLEKTKAANSSCCKCEMNSWQQLSCGNEDWKTHCKVL